MIDVEAVGWQHEVSGSGLLSVARPERPRRFCCVAADCVCFPALKVQSQPLPCVTSTRAGASLSGPDKPREISDRQRPFRHIVFFTYTSQQTAITCSARKKARPSQFCPKCALFFPPFSFLPQVLWVTQINEGLLAWRGRFCLPSVQICRCCRSPKCQKASCVIGEGLASLLASPKGSRCVWGAQQRLSKLSDLSQQGSAYLTPSSATNTNILHHNPETHGNPLPPQNNQRVWCKFKAVRTLTCLFI